MILFILIMTTDYSQKISITASASDNLKQYLKEKKRVIDFRLVKILNQNEQDESIKSLIASMQYTTLAKGKRLRPILTIAVYELYNKDIEEVIGPACAMEMIHSASLMLDDMPCMDNAKQRRGKKASHLVFGESTTILASAALWVNVFKILSEINSVKINAIVHETAESIGHLGLVQGQFLDLKSFKKSRTIEEIRKSYILKTGALFKNAVKTGALMANVSNKELRVWEKFGKDFGLAFQIRDDIIDAKSSEHNERKDLNIDVKNGKPTYVSLLGVKKAKLELSSMIDSICSDLKKIRKNTTMFIELTKSLKIK